MAASNAVVIRSAYRELLKSIKVAFAGDSRLLSQAHTEAKTSFRKIPTDTNITNDTKSGVNIASQQGVEHALSVAKILRENVVQGEASSENPHHLKLNIREDTERGDNETIKAPSNKSAVKISYKGRTSKFPKIPS